MGNCCGHASGHSSSNNTTPRSTAVGEIVTSNLKLFTLAELKAATKNFRQDSVVGEGGFGRVFKGYIDEKTFAPSKPGVGIAIAVKKSDQDTFEGLQQWLAEVKFLGRFSHPNLVKLLGYCREDDEFLLVYEYMPKGSLDRHIFGNGLPEPLSWKIRLRIAIGAAQGLAFLHSTENSVIYRDFKPSNILLDGAYNAKLSDFGLVKLGPVNGSSHVTTQVYGTYGYAAPEYVATGHLYVRSDVYGFGVVLLEMLTGLRALDANRPMGQRSLADWTKPMLSKKRTLRKIIDRRLEKDCPFKAALKMAELILKCLVADPRKRPSMQEVLDDLCLINGVKD